MRRLLPLVVLLAACAAVRAPVDDAPRMPGPGPRAIGAKRVNDTCIGCHGDHGWHGSAHANAFVDPVFQKALALEPTAFCRDCHAPETDAREAGVSCVTCHDPKGTGEILAVRPSRAPHAVRVAADFGTEKACANCHEFAFPGRTDAMQRTVSEHHASGSTASCASCHGAHDVNVDRSMLQRALAVKATRKDERLVLHVASKGVGHRVPTGDLFRRLVVSAEVSDDHLLMASAEAPIARKFRFEGREQIEISDDRIADARDVELDLGPAARGRAIAWRIEWQRVAAMHENEADVAETVVMAQGSEP